MKAVLPKLQMTLPSACLGKNSRIGYMENFLGTHPSLEEELRPEVHRLAFFFFLGIDNSPIHGSASDRINPEVLTAWRRFANDSSPSRYTSTVRKLLAILKAKKGTLGPDTEALTQWIKSESNQDARR